MEHGSRTAGDSHLPGTEYLKRQNRGVKQVSQLMCEKFRTVGVLRRCRIRGGLIPLPLIFGDRPGNRIVKASVEHTEVGAADDRAAQKLVIEALGSGKADLANFGGRLLRLDLRWRHAGNDNRGERGERGELSGARLQSFYKNKKYFF